MGTWKTSPRTGSTVSWSSSCESGGVSVGGESDDGCGGCGDYGGTCSTRPRTRSGSHRPVVIHTCPCHGHRWPGSILPGTRGSWARRRRTWTTGSRRRNGTWPSCRRGP